MTIGAFNFAITATTVTVTAERSQELIAFQKICESRRISGKPLSTTSIEFECSDWTKIAGCYDELRTQLDNAK